MKDTQDFPLIRLREVTPLSSSQDSFRYGLDPIMDLAKFAYQTQN